MAERDETAPETETLSETSAVETERDAASPEEAWDEARVLAVVEGLLFASPEPLAFRAIRDIVPEEAATTSALRGALDALESRYAGEGSGLTLVRIAGGFQIQTREDVFPWVRSLARTRVEDRVSPAALETLAIVAYKQPITRAEIDAIRGVGSGSLLRVLMDKKLVKVVGRVDLPGRPFQYGTTRQFLEQFGLGGLDDLPQRREL